MTQKTLAEIAGITEGTMNKNVALLSSDSFFSFFLMRIKN